jgi:hypothetical protein
VTRSTTASAPRSRAKVISTDAITYGRLVVQAYCPDQLSTYDDLVSGVDGVATTT